MNRLIFTTKPADTREENLQAGWDSATPIGNGFLGGMVYGDPINDVVQINEETVWGGKYGDNRVNPKAKDSWLKIRELIVEGKLKEAEALLVSDMYAQPGSPGWYDTAGYFRFDHKHTEYSDYKRTLDLDSAICTVEYTADGVAYKREYLVSAPDDVMAINYTSNGERNINLSFDMTRRGRDNTKEITLCENGIYLVASEHEGGCSYCVMAGTDSDGCVIYNEKGFEVYDASYLTVYITAKTSFRSENFVEWCDSKLAAALEKGYEAVRADHIADYRSYFNRVSLEIDGEDRSNIPTDERLLNTEGDETLASLYFDFARYLLISSSRPGSLPANLQGIWNCHAYAPWGGKYTININTEMNYWPAEVMNLPELHMQMLEHLKVMLPYGRKVAKEMYGLNGFVAHHNTDMFGDCAPVDHWLPATIWPMGAAWLLTHVKTHFDYTGDAEFLKEYLPIMKEACLFFTEYLFEFKGHLVTGPSVSPENTYVHPSGEASAICVGPAMDSQILNDLFSDTLFAAKLLGEEDELTAKVAEMLPGLPKPQIGKHGNIMEWCEDYEETEIGHRHISHLYGLFPSSQFTFEDTPELMTAARATLERRLSHGGGHTGWSRAWIINMWARLRDGEKARENVMALFSRSTYPNMFDKHPPFQIDGNFGGASGIAEMLLQSQKGSIVLLPALPAAWKSGRISGFRARGGVTVDMEWADGKVKYAKLISDSGKDIKVAIPEGCTAEYGDGTVEIFGK